MNRVWSHAYGTDTVFLTYEGLSVLTKSGSVWELQASRDELARKIERDARRLDKMNRMLEVMGEPTSCGK